MPKDLKTYHIPARWEFVGTAYVEAENEEDAIHRFERREGGVVLISPPHPDQLCNQSCSVGVKDE